MSAARAIALRLLAVACRTSSSSPPRPARRTSMTASFNFYDGGGVAAFDCNDDGLARPLLCRRQQCGGAVRQPQPAGRPLRFDQRAELIDRPARCHRRIPAGYRRRRQCRPGRASLRRERPAARAWATALFERANETWDFDRRRRLVDGLLGDLGEWRRSGRRWRSATTSTNRAPPTLLRQSAAAAGTGIPFVRRPDRPGARLVLALDALFELGSLGPGRPAGQQ